MLARAGARVRIVDRATFPRDKLCGDTINPGALQPPSASRITVRRTCDACGSPGCWSPARRPLGVRLAREAAPTVVTAPYPQQSAALAISRSVLDSALLDQAIAAGAQFEAGVDVLGAVTRDVRRRRDGRPASA